MQNIIQTFLFSAVYRTLVCLFHEVYHAVMNEKSFVDKLYDNIADYCGIAKNPEASGDGLYTRYNFKATCYTLFIVMPSLKDAWVAQKTAQELAKNEKLVAELTALLQDLRNKEDKLEFMNDKYLNAMCAKIIHNSEFQKNISKATTQYLATYVNAPPPATNHSQYPNLGPSYTDVPLQINYDLYRGAQENEAY